MTTRPRSRPTGDHGPFTAFVEDRGYALLDGGLATELEAHGADLSGGLWSARMLAERPSTIEAVHQAYLQAGADCLITATYQATIDGFRRHGVDAHQAEALMVRAVTLAQRVRDRFWQNEGNRPHRRRPLVAASIGPYGAARADGSEYTGSYDLDAAGLADFHRARLALLAHAQPDLLAIETIPSGVEALTLVGELDALADRQPVPPAWMSFTCRDAQHLSDGTALADVVPHIVACRAIIALGVNCVPPSRTEPLLRGLRKITDCPLVAYPNSGERWDAAHQCWRGDALPDDFAQRARSWHLAGATIIGGCCRTGPRHIGRLRTVLGAHPTAM